MNKHKQAMKDFEDIIDKATINVLSKKSLEQPLTKEELEKYKGAFQRYYNPSNFEEVMKNK